jgi:hypothetical protein
MAPNPRHRLFLESVRDLPESQIVGLIGSHRRVVWPPVCPACGAPALTALDVARISGRRSRRGGYSRRIVRMRIPFCQSCAARHQQLVEPASSMIGSFLRTPAILSLAGAVAVSAILWMVFIQGGEGLSAPGRLYALAGIVSLLAFGIWTVAREARFGRVPQLTEVTRAAEFSENVGFPFGRRRLYAIRNRAAADAFRSANQDRLWTDAIRKRDAWISGLVFVVLIVAALIAWFVRGSGTS